jgi:hypothetical protein
MTLELGVKVGIYTTLEKRILGKVDATNDMARLEANLLCLSEVVDDIAVELHLSKPGHGNHILRKELGRVQDIKAVGQGVGFRDNLDTKLVFGEVALIDSIVQVLTMIVEVLTSSRLGFFPNHTSNTLQTSPLDSDVDRVASIGHKAVSVNGISIYMAERTWDAMASHEPEHGVKSARLRGEEVIGSSVGGATLGDLGLRLGLDRMNQIRELAGILDEEGGHGHSDNICFIQLVNFGRVGTLRRGWLTVVAFVSVEPGGKSVHITDSVWTSPKALNRGESYKSVCLFPLSTEEIGRGDVGPIAVGSEGSICSYSSGMHNTFGNLIIVSLVVVE